MCGCVGVCVCVCVHVCMSVLCGGLCTCVYLYVFLKAIERGNISGVCDRGGGVATLAISARNSITPDQCPDLPPHQQVSAAMFSTTDSFRCQSTPTQNQVFSVPSVKDHMTRMGRSRRVWPPSGTSRSASRNVPCSL